MKNPLFIQYTKYWITAFEYNQYLEFKKYLEDNININKSKYLTYYSFFDHSDKDYLILYCRPVPKKIKGGIFGYLILNNKSSVNDIDGIHIKVFNDDLVNRCYSEIDKYVINDNFLYICDIVGNLGIIEKSFSIKYIKKFLKMENIPSNIGDFIIKKLDEYNEKDSECESIKKNIYKKNNKRIIKKFSDTESDSDSNSESDTESESNNNSESDNDSDTESENNSNSESDSDDDQNSKKSESEIDEDNKNGVIPIIVELCKKFKFPNIKYDKKKYSILKNPDVDEKIKYFKKHIVNCEKCNIINNNNRELSNYIITSKISFQEHLKIKSDLEEGIEKYQNSQRYDGFGYDLDENNMKINYINDDENIYKNCLLIYITLKSEE